MNAQLESWEKWEAEEAGNIKKAKKLQRDGHTLHCACRIVWGDGICTCTPGNWILQGKERADRLMEFMRETG